MLELRPPLLGQYVEYDAACWRGRTASHSYIRQELTQLEADSLRTLNAGPHAVGVSRGAEQLHGLHACLLALIHDEKPTLHACLLALTHDEKVLLFY